MKLSSLLVAGSLAVNVALAAVYVVRSFSDPATASGNSSSTNSSGAGIAGNGTGSAGKNGGAAATSGSATNVGAASEKIWASLNTGDLRTLAARLHAAGFPPSVVRSVIYMQVNDIFKARREALAPSNEDPFWKTDPTGGRGYDTKYWAAMRDLGREQTKMVKDILGADATAPGESELSDYQRRRFGDLPRDKIDQLQQLDQDYNEMRNEVNSAARGIILPEDREKLAVLEKEKRADLAQLLSPQEMEDYLMRTSQTTNRLRNTLTAFHASESEFRAIYQAQSAYDDKYSYQNVGGAFTPELMKDRQAAQTQVNDQIKAALGDERYADYTRSNDREFQQLNRIAQQASLPDNVALQVYDLRNSTLKESNRIFDDASLTNDQKRTALQSLGQNARTQITSTLGTEVGAQYQQVANRWLSGLDRGAAVTLNENGGMNIRNVPIRRPNPNPAAGAPVPAPAATPSK